MDVGGQMQLFRRQCYEDVGGVPPLRWGGEDTAANVMARRKGWDVRVFTDIHAQHRRRTGSAGTSVCRSRFRNETSIIDLSQIPFLPSNVLETESSLCPANRLNVISA